MSKYGTGTDPYTYPNTYVLINKLGIQSEYELNSVEYELTELALLEIEFQPSPYSFKYWCYLHQQLFKDIYSWAGEIRVIDISKGNTRFCNVNRIDIEAKKIFNKLADENYLVDYERPLLIRKLAEFYSDLNVIHPFREGNGRTQRVLFEHIVVNCGYQISFQAITAEQWLQANIAAYFGDNQAMTVIFNKCLSDS